MIADRMEQVRKAATLLRRLKQYGQIQLTDSGPSILGQHVVIAPRSLFTKLIEVYADDPVLEQHIYAVMKDAVYDFCEELDDTHDMDAAEMLETLTQLAQLNGYGHINVTECNREGNEAAFYIRDLPSEAVESDRQFRGDTYWAGMLAGGMRHVFGTDVDALETQCVLEGATSCRFVVAPPERLEAEHPDLYRQKFGSS